MSPLESFSKAILPSSVNLTLSLVLKYLHFTVNDHVLFSFHNGIESFFYFCYRERREPKSCTSTLYRGGNLVDVVTNDAESNVLCILLDDTSESCLCLLCHHVCFIENNELVSLRKECSGFGKLLYLFAYNVNTTIVGGVKLGCISRW